MNYLTGNKIKMSLNYHQSLFLHSNSVIYVYITLIRTLTLNASVHIHIENPKFSRFIPLKAPDYPSRKFPPVLNYKSIWTSPLTTVTPRSMLSLWHFTGNWHIDIETFQWLKKQARTLLYAEGCWVKWLPTQVTVSNPNRSETIESSWNTLISRCNFGFRELLVRNFHRQELSWITVSRMSKEGKE